jgi:hypothetical protein
MPETARCLRAQARADGPDAETAHAVRMHARRDGPDAEAPHALRIHRPDGADSGRVRGLRVLGPPDAPDAAEARPGRRYVVLSFPSPIRPGVIESPVLAILSADDPGWCAWSPGSPPVPLPPHTSILCEYPVDACDAAWADWQRAEFAFACDFPPNPGEPRPGPAWVSPNGDFYACRWMQHDRLAYRLAAAVYADPRGPWALEQRGWLRIGQHGTAIRSSFREPPSQGQLNVLFSLLQVSDGAFRESIREELLLARLLAERSQRD